MKTEKLSVEIFEAKRFNDKGIEMFRPSDTVRLVDAKGTLPRGDNQVATSDGDYYNVYSGTVVMAEVNDWTDTTRLAERIKADLYAGDDRSASECLTDVVNNGGLRLAYGDLIKSQYKTGNGTGAKALVAATKWIIETGQTAAYLAQASDVRDQWLLKQYAERAR